MSWEFRSWEDYYIPGSNVLRNLLPATEKYGEADADRLERFELTLTGSRVVELAGTPVVGAFDLPHLQEVHRRIFSMCIPELGNYVAHPFREGNTRTQIVFFTQYLASIGLTLDAPARHRKAAAETSSWPPASTPKQPAAVTGSRNCLATLSVGARRHRNDSSNSTEGSSRRPRQACDTTRQALVYTRVRRVALVRAEDVKAEVENAVEACVGQRLTSHVATVGKPCPMTVKAPTSRCS